MKIRGRDIGPSHPPYVIAEVSCNHAGSENVAHALIQVAKDAGAEAVKFQFYTPEGMVGPLVTAVDIGFGAMAQRGSGLEPIESGPWAGESMYSLYDRSKMPFEWGPRLKAECHKQGLSFIASAYEMDGLNWLEQNCQPDAYKVASFEATDTPFVEAVAGTEVPIILSLGMMDEAEKWNVIGVARDAALLHCVSAYPAFPRDANLERSFCGHPGKVVPLGFSDHTLGHSVACAAVAKGACVLEKHIQLHPSLKTADSHFSATPQEFADYCRNVKEAWEACQPPVSDAEKDSRQFRRAPGGKRGSYRG